LGSTSRGIAPHDYLLLLGALGAILFAQRDDLAHDLGVEARRLGLAVHLLDVGGDVGLLLFKLLDARDELAQPLLRALRQ
jgi:hypothetical protein